MVRVIWSCSCYSTYSSFAPNKGLIMDCDSDEQLNLQQHATSDQTLCHAWWCASWTNLDYFFVNCTSIEIRAIRSIWLFRVQHALQMHASTVGKSKFPFIAGHHPLKLCVCMCVYAKYKVTFMACESHIKTRKNSSATAAAANAYDQVILSVYVDLIWFNNILKLRDSMA